MPYHSQGVDVCECVCVCVCQRSLAVEGTKVICENSQGLRNPAEGGSMPAERQDEYGTS